MVSLGDTAISLHILQLLLRGGILESQNPKCQDLPKFQFSGGELFWKVKTQSAKICLNFNFQGGGVFWNQIPEQGCSGEFGQKFLET